MTEHPNPHTAVLPENVSFDEGSSVCVRMRVKTQASLDDAQAAAHGILHDVELDSVERDGEHVVFVINPPGDGDIGFYKQRWAGVASRL